MWSAIIQAIDHAMGRLHEGSGAGIKVANSQHGGSAPISNMDSGAGEVVKQNLRNQQDTTSEQKEAAEKAKIGSNSTPTGEVGASRGASEGASTSAGAGTDSAAGSGVLPKGIESAGTDSAAGSGVLPKGIESAGADTAAGSEGVGSVTGSGSAGAAGSILSDEKAKEAKSVSAKTAAINTVSGWKKARNYGTNLSKGFANAGAIATGQGKQYDLESPSIVDFDKDITKDFKADSTNIKKSK